MIKLFKQIILLMICARLLYIEPKLEFMLFEIIGIIIIFLEFNFVSYLKKEV